jgi:uncharacterized C2H2 Zn-finger protein
MMDIQVFHRYNNLADEGTVKQLTCPDCDQVYVTRCTEDGEPLLACVWCDTIVKPGLRLYQQVLAVVREHSE